MKYKITVKHKNGNTTENPAEHIVFWPGKGGIDIFQLGNDVPFFPGREEDVESVTITFNRKPS